jgi:hypothetical protein
LRIGEPGRVINAEVVMVALMVCVEEGERLKGEGGWGGEVNSVE